MPEEASIVWRCEAREVWPLWTPLYLMVDTQLLLWLKLQASSCRRLLPGHLIPELIPMLAGRGRCPPGYGSNDVNQPINPWSPWEVPRHICPEASTHSDWCLSISHRGLFPAHRYFLAPYLSFLVCFLALHIRIHLVSMSSQRWDAWHGCFRLAVPGRTANHLKSILAGFHAMV
jgi:hypothetical protein